MFFAPKYANKEGQSGLTYHFPCPRKRPYSSCFLAETQQKRVFLSKIREERRPIRAHLPLSVPPQEAVFIRSSGKNSSKTCFLIQNTRRKKANEGSPTIFRVLPRGLLSSCFLEKNHQTRVFLVPDTPLGGEELQRKSGFWRCFLVSRGRGVDPPFVYVHLYVM